MRLAFSRSLKGRRVYGLYDTGSKVTVLVESLAKELGLPITPYERTFHQAAGHVGCFIGKQGPSRCSCIMA